MNNFESGSFTYTELEGDTSTVQEQSLAAGVTISGEDSSLEKNPEQESIFLDLKESGVFIEPFEPFYIDGSAPQSNAR